MNLEYLGRVVFETDGLLYPDSVVGTDSHTTMINGLGIVGWGGAVCLFVCSHVQHRSVCLHVQECLFKGKQLSLMFQPDTLVVFRDKL